MQNPYNYNINLYNTTGNILGSSNFPEYILFNKFIASDNTSYYIIPKASKLTIGYYSEEAINDYNDRTYFGTNGISPAGEISYANVDSNLPPIFVIDENGIYNDGGNIITTRTYTDTSVTPNKTYTYNKKALFLDFTFVEYRGGATGTESHRFYYICDETSTEKHFIDNIDISSYNLNTDNVIHINIPSISDDSYNYLNNILTYGFSCNSYFDTESSENTLYVPNQTENNFIVNNSEYQFNNISNAIYNDVTDSTYGWSLASSGSMYKSGNSVCFKNMSYGTIKLARIYCSTSVNSINIYHNTVIQCNYYTNE